MQTNPDQEKRKSYISKHSAKFLVLDFFIFLFIIVLYSQHAFGGLYIGHLYIGSLYIWVFLLCFLIPSFFIPKIRYGKSSKSIQGNNPNQVFYCTRCGFPLENGKQFCSKCGSRR